MAAGRTTDEDRCDRPVRPRWRKPRQGSSEVRGFGPDGDSFPLPAPLSGESGAGGGNLSARAGGERRGEAGRPLKQMGFKTGGPPRDTEGWLCMGPEREAAEMRSTQRSEDTDTELTKWTMVPDQIGGGTTATDSGLWAPEHADSVGGVRISVNVG
ncbi:hypothetical protein NDU88_002170 [Pleurodeles waltl]|uniref:Uncharacterized protein n=1 Tax=Pleurodeles waltl TaxID=8319 RepID=A0AAV7WKG3_PLEWA|nr:hypothetical protein NDU88_002170 [Pleurodeles waltl]